MAKGPLCLSEEGRPLAEHAVPYGDSKVTVQHRYSEGTSLARGLAEGLDEGLTKEKTVTGVLEGWTKL